MANLTKRQKEILDYLQTFIKKKGYSPTVEEIRRHFKLSAISTVHEHLKTLENKKFVKKSEHKARGIELINSTEMMSLPLLGTISAGYPIEAIEIRETIAVPKNRFPYQANLFALKVSGDSMMDENISNGDIVIVKKQNYADDGDKVVALINNNEVTLKSIYKEKNSVRLQPANENFKPLFVKKGDINIQGVVIDLIKTVQDTDITFQQNKINTAFKNVSNGIFLDSNLKLDNIYNVDCFDLMSKIKDNSINLIFSDPPYNLSKSNFKMKFKKSGGSDLNTNKGKWDKYTDEEFESFTKRWLSECFRILKPNGSIWVAGTYHNIYLTGYLMQKLGFDILNEVLWHKTDATPNLSCTRFVADHENFIWARKGKNNIFNYTIMKELNGGKQMRSIWPKGKTTGGKKIHPTQKPEWLLERIILATSNSKDIIFDPFMGSGTTAVVAKKNDRKYLGSEMDKLFFKEAIKRIEKI